MNSYQVFSLIQQSISQLFWLPCLFRSFFISGNPIYQFWICLFAYWVPLQKIIPSFEFFFFFLKIPLITSNFQALGIYSLWSIWSWSLYKLTDRDDLTFFYLWIPVFPATLVKDAIIFQRRFALLSTIRRPSHCGLLHLLFQHVYAFVPV